MAEFWLAALAVWVIPWVLARSLLRQWTPHRAGERPRLYFTTRIWFLTTTVASFLAEALRCFPDAEPTIVVWICMAALSQPWHLRQARNRREGEVAYRRLLARFQHGETFTSCRAMGANG